MMNFEAIGTNLVADEDLPWTPYVPYSDAVEVKLLKADPIRGETIALLKVPAGMTLPRHDHTGTVIVYTVKGAWRYLEHDWIATPGSIVFETAGTQHQPVAVAGHGDEIITLNITTGELLYFDDEGALMARETWRTMVQRYLDYCAIKGLEPRDVTSFAG